MSNTSNIYSLLEQHIKVYLQAVVQQIAGYDDTYEKRTVAKLGQHFVEVYTSFDAYEIAVFHEETRELFAYAKYDREKEIVLYALKFHVVKDCLNELIKMFSIEIFEKCRLRIAGVNCVGINGAVYTPSFTSSFFIALSTQKFSLYRLQVDDHRAMPIVLCNIHTLLTI